MGVFGFGFFYINSYLSKKKKCRARQQPTQQNQQDHTAHIPGENIQTKKPPTVRAKQKTSTNTNHEANLSGDTPTFRAQPNHTPAHNPAKGTKAHQRTTPSQRGSQPTLRTTRDKNIKRQGPSLTHCSVPWIIRNLLETRNS